MKIVRIKVTIVTKIRKFNANGKIQLAKEILKENSIYQFRNGEVKDRKLSFAGEEIKALLLIHN